jgi:hypothetical protein
VSRAPRLRRRGRLTCLPPAERLRMGSNSYCDSSTGLDQRRQHPSGERDPWCGISRFKSSRPDQSYALPHGTRRSSRLPMRVPHPRRWVEPDLVQAKHIHLFEREQSALEAGHVGLKGHQAGSRVTPLDGTRPSGRTRPAPSTGVSCVVDGRCLVDKVRGRGRKSQLSAMPRG